MSIPALTTTSSTVLGKMLVESAILFEASAAELVAAEGEKLQLLVKAAAVTPTPPITATQLVEVNNDIKDIVCCLAGLENAILRKIAAGTSLINNGF